ncbi:pentapeptide repeat-containing protein [Furfurilactobacillus curtus]|uniref:Pentapeptide repeat-containing protein n=1 Tax=Furfurilactobacillus curtus TaxID=1746200 RepID=A0ABQ5JN95_9LACO
MSDLVEVRDQTLSLDQVETNTRYINCQFTVSNLPIRLMDVIFERCQFEQSNFDEAELVHVELDHVQLVNTSWRQTRWYDCQASNVQLAGGDFSGAIFKQTRFTASKLTYANFSEAQLTSSQLIDCELSESVFQVVTIKQGLSFNGSRLTDADFTETRLAGVDWHNAEFETLRVSADLIRGLIVNEFQAAQLIGLFGVEIQS